MIGKTAVIILDMQKIVWEMNYMNLTPNIYSENSFPRFKEAVKCLYSSTFLDFIEDSILKSQYENYIKFDENL